MSDSVALDTGFESKAGSVKMIPLSLVVVSDVALRGVQRNKEEFDQLVHSVRSKGVLQSILVREIEVNGVTKYGLIDGLQRFTAAGDVGLTEIPARIVTMDDAAVLEAQIVANLTRIETKPADVAKHLLRMLYRDPMTTIASLADRLSQSEQWVKQRLGLLDLHDDIQELVNTGNLNLTNAYALSRVSPEAQRANLDAARTEATSTFVPRMKELEKAERKAKAEGRDKTQGFQPVMHMRKPGEVKEEITSPTRAKQICANAGLTSEDALKGFKEALLWVMHFDPASKDEQIKLHEQREAARKAEQLRLKEQKAAERQAAEAAKAADVSQW